MSNQSLKSEECSRHVSNLSVVNDFNEGNVSNKQSNKFSTVETNSSHQNVVSKEDKVFKAKRTVKFKGDSKNNQKFKHYKANKNKYISTRTIVDTDKVSSFNIGKVK